MCDFESRPPAWLFACDVCGEQRPRHLIQLTRHDVSDQVGLDEGALERTVRCCGDRRACLELAEDPQHWRIVPEDFDPWETFGNRRIELTGDGQSDVIAADGDMVERDALALMAHEFDGHWSEQE